MPPSPDAYGVEGADVARVMPVDGITEVHRTQHISRQNPEHTLAQIDAVRATLTELKKATEHPDASDSTREFYVTTLLAAACMTGPRRGIDGR
ncbi:hypothetical protein [Streptomyces sp. C36]|uniref:hypothetical protein n=1 Tax=Streptomyces sp. C36 TaxID=3237122 RepID=UPI0034C6B3D4